MMFSIASMDLMDVRIHHNDGIGSKLLLSGVSWISCKTERRTNCLVDGRDARWERTERPRLSRKKREERGRKKRGEKEVRKLKDKSKDRRAKSLSQLAADLFEAGVRSDGVHSRHISHLFVLCVFCILSSSSHSGSIELGYCGMQL